MELQIAGTNLSITDRVRTYAERKIGKLTRHWPNIIETRVEISVEKTKTPDQRILIRVNIDGDGAGFHGVARAEDPIKAIDKVSEVMIRQVEHYKGKMVGKSRTPGRKEATAAAAELPPAPETRLRKVVKVKSFQIKPVSLQEAIEEMEMLAHDFFLFRDADTEEVKLLYRRNDGDYGLIEPRTK